MIGLGVIIILVILFIVGLVWSARHPDESPPVDGGPDMPSPEAAQERNKQDGSKGQAH